MTPSSAMVDSIAPGRRFGSNVPEWLHELHGGRIWVDGEVGKGTTFTFRIPAMAVVTG